MAVWQWDEMVQRGTDYGSLAEVEAYDRRMATLRDPVGEAEQILDRLDVGPDDVVLEVGTGTGAFARVAAQRCRRVIAVDVSPVMLEYAADRARAEHLENIEFRVAGFLTYEHEGGPVAAAVSQLALHHLPDAWKLVALRRLAGVLGDGGGLYLSDVVFPDWALDDWGGYLQRLIDSAPADRRDEFACHVREEFSTFDWIMRGILERSGFAVEHADLVDGFLGHYLCRTTSRAGP